jgi:hypothetical protein
VTDNTGAFNALERINGSIGYLAWNFASSFKTARTALLQNADGNFYNINQTYVVLSFYVRRLRIQKLIVFVLVLSPRVQTLLP